MHVAINEIASEMWKFHLKITLPEFASIGRNNGLKSRLDMKDI